MVEIAADERVAKALEQKQILTTRISETVRTLCFGVLALVYGLISADSAYATHARAASALPLKIAAIAAVLALTLDYLQYLFGRLSVGRALSRTDAPGRYDAGWWPYRLREAAFWSKQAVVIAAVAAIIVVIARSL